MKRPIAFLLLFMLTFLSYSQSDTNEGMSYTHCLIVGQQSNLLKPHKVKVQVDFGQGIKLWSPRESMLKDQNGKPIVFESMVDAMNFMSSKGWTFENAYAMPKGSGYVHHWLLKKLVPNEELTQ